METDVKHLVGMRKSYVMKNEPHIYDSVVNFNKDIFNGELKWGRLFWHYTNGVNELPNCYCGNTLMFKSPKQGYREFCSKRCMYDSKDIKEKRRESNIKKYGVDNPSKSKEIRDKIERTNIEKYGVKYPLQNGKMVEKNKEYFLEKYGVDNPSNIESVKEKRRMTMMDRYGAISYSKTDEYHSKSTETKLDRYGDENYNNIDKIKATKFERYGDVNYNNKEKRKDTILSKYGVSSYTMTDDYKKAIKERTILKNVEYYKQYGIRLVKYNNPNSVELFCDKCNDSYIITKQLFIKRVLNNGEEPCLKCNELNYSKSENIVKEFLDELNIHYIPNDRNILGGKELDIYIPSMDVAIEFNGLYWHSDLHKDNDYHYNKMKDCEDIGINLIQIWEDQWLYKEDIVKSILKSKLGLISDRIYARKCEIRVVSYSDSKDFLELCHIQGNSVSSIRYGLYYNDELVSLMTFGKLRKNLGQKSTEVDFELLRFCNLLNTGVIGGFSKLLKHFMETNECESLVSYAMCDYSNGNVYIKNGFKLDKHTGPNYYYFKNKIRYNRFTFRKDVLVSEGYDKSKTERIIMTERGYNRIYDSGSYKYVYVN